MKEQQYESKSIMEMARGAILERVDFEMERVLKNIQDANTSPTAKRKLTVSLELLPSADRKTIIVKATAKSVLTPTEPVVTSLAMGGMPGTGEATVYEMTPQIPGQYSLDGTVQDPPKVLKLPMQAQA